MIYISCFSITTRQTYRQSVSVSLLLLTMCFLKASLVSQENSPLKLFYCVFVPPPPASQFLTLSHSFSPLYLFLSSFSLSLQCLTGIQIYSGVSQCIPFCKHQLLTPWERRQGGPGSTQHGMSLKLISTLSLRTYTVCVNINLLQYVYPFLPADPLHTLVPPLPASLSVMISHRQADSMAVSSVACELF